MRGGAGNYNSNGNGLLCEQVSPAHGARQRNVKELLGLWMERNRAPVRASRPGQLGPATRRLSVEQFSAPPRIPRALRVETRCGTSLREISMRKRPERPDQSTPTWSSVTLSGDSKPTHFL
jgi:hypothetical protein